MRGGGDDLDDRVFKVLSCGATRSEIRADKCGLLRFESGDVHQFLVEKQAECSDSIDTGRNYRLCRGRWGSTIIGHQIIRIKEVEYES
jgi:UDP-3-O-[3-hydroxymyristoyl] glucosamine N-acyltransferase